MSSTLSAATQDRKARLAQLKSLKRKQPDSSQEASEPAEGDDASDVQPLAESPRLQSDDSFTTPIPPDKPSYLSGRNYDPTTRGPKLGFELAPSSEQSTLEKRAAELAEQTRAQAAAEEAEDKPLDLFKLQPKKLNWDLKRDLERKLEVLNVRTENAIARLVRDRIAGAKGRAVEANGNGNAKAVQGQRDEGDGEELGMEGTVLVEATKEREREDEEDARRERELDEELVGDS